MLNDIISALGMTRDNFFLVVVTGLGSIGSVAAALAAWGAAKATQASVEEMKEARLQAVRPSLVLGTGGQREITLAWSAGGRARLLQGDVSAEIVVGENPAVLLTNIGTGSAVEIQIDWTRADRKQLSDKQIETIQCFFQRGGFSVKKRNLDCLDISDPMLPGVNKCSGWAAGAHSVTQYEICPVGEQIRFQIIDDTIFSLLAEIIADQGEFGGNVRLRTDQIDVSYQSISGERFHQKYALTYLGDYVQAYRNGRGSKGAEEWNSIRSGLSISLKKIEPRQFSWLRNFGFVKDAETASPG